MEKIGEKKGKGITVDGIPLEDVVDQEEGKRKKSEISSEYNESQRQRCKVKKKPVIKERRPVKTKVAKRVRYLTDEQIRLEKGIKMKSLGSIRQDVIWLLVNRPSITAQSATEELGKSPASVSSILAASARLIPDLVDIDKTKKPFVYKLVPKDGEEYTFDEVYDLVKKRESEMRIAKRQGKRAPTVPDSAIETEKVVEVKPGPPLSGVAYHVIVDINFNINLGRRKD